MTRNYSSTNVREVKGKSLLSLGDNTVIYSCFNVALSSNCFSNIIVATTSNPEDDVLVNYLKKENDHFRGSEENVYSRFFEISKLNNSNLLPDLQVIIH